MPPQPPPTPWMPTSRFADESLLLTTRPIFGDVSLGEESDWGQGDDGESDDMDFDGDETSRQAQVPGDPTDRAAELTLDLGDYLPDDGDSARTEWGGAEDNPTPSSGTDTNDGAYTERGASSVSRAVYKRDASITLLTGQPAKRAKPPVLATPVPTKDDFFARRLSNSTSTRPSSSTPRGSSTAILPSPTVVPSRPSLVSSSSSSSASSYSSSSSASSLPTNCVPRRELDTASSRLKDTIRRPENNGNDSTKTRIKLPGALTTSQAQHPKHDSLSALSRHVVTATITNASEVTLATPPPDRSRFAAVDPEPSTISKSAAKTVRSEPSVRTVQSTAIPYVDDDRTRPTSSRSSSSIGVSQSSEEAPPMSSTPIAAIVASESRRSSMSGRVVGFISDLMRSVPSSSLRAQADNQGQKIEKQGGNGKDEELDDSSAEESNGTGEIECEKTRITKEAADRGQKSIPPITQAIRPARSNFVPLTRPIPFSRQLHLARTAQHQNQHQPLQPSRVQSKSSTVQSKLGSSGKPVLTKGVSQAGPPKRQATTSAFASAALARLPPPGKGASSAARPVEVKAIERASDLGVRRSVFERLASNTSKPPVTNGGSSGSHSQKHTEHEKRKTDLNGKKSLTTTTTSGTTGITPTIPMHGHTPGKASQVRAQQRSRFDAAVSERLEQKERAAKMEAQRKAREEEAEYAQRRKETVIWARPVPSMYQST